MEYSIGGSSNNARKVLIHEAIYCLENLQVANICNPRKDPKLTGSNIIFLEREACRLIHPHIDSFAITHLMANITLHQILIDIDSLVDFLFPKAWKQMKLSYPLKQMTIPLVGFYALSLILEGNVTLPITTG